MTHLSQHTHKSVYSVKPQLTQNFYKPAVQQCKLPANPVWNVASIITFTHLWNKQQIKSSANYLLPEIAVYSGAIIDEDCFPQCPFDGTTPVSHFRSVYYLIFCRNCLLRLCLKFYFTLFGEGGGGEWGRKGEVVPQTGDCYTVNGTFHYFIGFNQFSIANQELQDSHQMSMFFILLWTGCFVKRSSENTKSKKKL